jgi:hypothetical protein
MKNNKKKALSKAVIVIPIMTVIVISGIAGLGLFGSHAQTQTSSTSSSVSQSAVTTTVTQTASGSSGESDKPWSAGALNGQVDTFVYTGAFGCTPPASSFFKGEDNASNVASGCEIGAANSTDPAANPDLWVIVPAYAGLSIFGVPKLGATSQGFPTYINNQTVLTMCGAGGTASACPDHPTYMYSPAFTTVEQYLNITNGVFGLPEGVLPTPAHSHIVNQSDTQGWNIIAVLVFDPNIFPNPVTGQCSQIVPSNQPNPTANCLNSYAALQRALATNDSASDNANCNYGANPIYEALGQPPQQIVIPGDSTVQSIGNANTNLQLFFSAQSGNPYPPFSFGGDLTSNSSTVTSSSSSP